MSNVAMIRLKQPVFITTQGKMTAEDTGILMSPAGDEQFVTDKKRQDFMDIGISFEVLEETEEGAFKNALNEYAKLLREAEARKLKMAKEDWRA